MCLFCHEKSGKIKREILLFLWEFLSNSMNIQKIRRGDFSLFT